jgi:outer membrane lipoprotein SlyB
MKIAMGAFWIGFVGWAVIGSILAWSIGMFSSNPAAKLLGPVAGIGMGIALYNRWLNRRSAKS